MVSLLIAGGRTKDVMSNLLTMLGYAFVVDHTALDLPAFYSALISEAVRRAADVLLKHRTEAITFIHAEVYTDDSLQISTEAVHAFGLDYEPALFLAKADGTIVDRLDVIFDSDDVVAGLARLA